MAAAVRLLDQEPDCTAIIPTSPSHVVFGTYSLVNGANADRDAARKGSLQILPFSSHSASAAQSPLYRKDFSFGIYDIHFHGRYDNLLGVATSNAEILFFEVHSGQDGNTEPQFQLMEKGRVLVEEPHDVDGRLAIVTQFQFLDIYETAPDGRRIVLLATTQFGNTKMIKTQVPTNTNSDQLLETQILNVHRQGFDLEAWTVLGVPISKPSTQEQGQLLVLSGGDDSQLLISSVDVDLGTLVSEMDLDTVTSTKVYTDVRTHEAGIVSICCLGPFHTQVGMLRESEQVTDHTLFLTGSYDETLRLFLLTLPQNGNPRHRVELLSKLKMEGGVWRIVLLDSYSDAVQMSSDYVLLIAGHTAGAHIVRLSLGAKTSDGAGPANGWEYSFKIEKSFQQPESLVYAVTAKADASERGKWLIVSTSFYEKKVCNWEWTDPNREQN